MNLRDAMRDDVGAFLNLDEFGEEIDINGVRTVGLWNDRSTNLPSTSLSGVADVNSFGLLGDERELFVCSPTSISSSLQALGLAGIEMPLVDQRLNIDGEYWTVLPGTHDNAGILHLKLLRVYS